MLIKSMTSVLIILLLSACAVFIPRRIGPADIIKVEITPEKIALGKKLAEGIMACGSCHTTGTYQGEPRQDMQLAGDVIYSQMEGKIAVPNITPDRETGIGSWTDGEIIRAITKGLNRDNRVLVPLMPWANYGAVLTREESEALVAYLRAGVAPVNHKPEDTDLTMLMSAIISTGMVYNMFAKEPFFNDYKPSRATPVDRGKRLGYLGMCVDCHSYAPKMGPRFGEPLAGGIVVQKTGGLAVVAANLTPDMETGIGSFSDEELYDSIKYGKRLRPLPDTDMVRWPMMPRIPYHTSLTDDEIGDLIAFFRSQEPVKHDIMAKYRKLNE